MRKQTTIASGDYEITSSDDGTTIYLAGQTAQALTLSQTPPGRVLPGVALTIVNQGSQATTGDVVVPAGSARQIEISPTGAVTTTA